MINKMAKKEDLVKQYNLEEAVKRIQKINEYTFYDSTVLEDDQDQEPMDNGQMPQGDPTQGGMPQMDGQGGEQMPPISGADPSQAMPQGGQQAQVDGGQIPQGDMGGEMPPMDAEDPNAPQGDVPPMEGEEGVEDIEMEPEQEGDEVIDVDELTQSQETTEFKVDHVDDKLNKVLKVISKFTDAIEANDQKIEDLKKEFEKRNPTAQETLNLRSLAATPFSEKPDEYWKKQQELHPNYNVISDNDVSTADEQQKYEIRQSDIDNFNERDIMKSLGENHIKLADFLDF